MLIVALILLQAIIFVILIFVFRRILTQNVTLATRHLDVMNEDFSRKEQEITRQLGESKKKSEDIIIKAKDEAEKLKAQIIKEAEGKRDVILQEAQTKGTEIIEQAEKSRQLLISEMEERIEKESINKACGLAHLILPDEFKKSMHLKCIQEITESGFQDIERLHIPSDIKEVKITTAFSLNEKQLDSIAKKLKKLIPGDIKINEEVDPKIAAGLIISMGSLVLDGSLKSKIKEESKNIENI
ncbi:MAG: F0F1 ATP synthase subunit delta [Candidatus Omnitrophota bacterium]